MHSQDGNAICPSEWFLTKPVCSKGVGAGAAAISTAVTPQVTGKVISRCHNHSTDQLIDHAGHPPMHGSGTPSLV